MQAPLFFGGVPCFQVAKAYSSCHIKEKKITILKSQIKLESKLLSSLKIQKRK